MQDNLYAAPAILGGNSGMQEVAELAEVLAAYRRFDDVVTWRCSSFKVVHLAALAENLRRLHRESGNLALQLERRIALMPA